MFLRAFFTAAAFLVPTLCPAAPPPHGVDQLDPKCPPGTHSGFETNVFQFNVPAEGFFNKTGSFFHSEWYTEPLSSTHGKDNTVGATRSGIDGGTFYTERLVRYSRSADQLTLSFVLANGPVVYKGLTLASYTDEMRITSICSGRGTYFSMAVVFCADRTVEVYGVYDRIRREVVDAVADQLGAAVFAGTCPVGKN